MRAILVRCIGAITICLALAWLVSISPAVGADVPLEPADLQPGPATCTLIDTDFDIDDMMAIPLVIGSRFVAGIVTSEGYSRPADGASALSRLLAEPGQRQIPLIVGASSNLPDNTIRAAWGQFVLDFRAMMRKSFALLSVDLPPAPVGTGYVAEVEQVTEDCDTVDILIIGTFTSFIHYSPAIRAKINNVVIMGMPLRGDPTLRPGNFSFNCEYDMKACETAFDQQLPGLTHVFVAPRRTVFDKDPVGHHDTVYGPTLTMVEALQARGLPNSLKQSLVGTVHGGSLGEAVKGADYWAIDCCFKAGGKSLLWDQSAALFLIHPEAFEQVGKHYEPRVSPGELRELWTRATNRATIYVSAPDRP